MADTWTPMQPFRECGCREGYCMPVATVVTVQNILKLFSVAETGAHTQGTLARRAASAPGDGPESGAPFPDSTRRRVRRLADDSRAMPSRAHTTPGASGDEGSSNRLQICNMYRNSRPCRDLQVWPEFEPQCCRLVMTSV